MESAHWTNEALDGMASFKANALLLCASVQRLYAQGRDAEAARLMAEFRDLRGRLVGGDMYQHWLYNMLQLQYYKTAWLISRGKFEVAAQLLCMTQRIIDQQAREYRDHHWTGIKLKRDGNLAYLKWLAGPQMERAVALPDEIVGWWLESDAVCAALSRQEAGALVMRSDGFELTSSLSGINVAKMACRYCPERFDRVIDRHNERFGFNLPHDSREAQRSDSRQWAYWEIAFALEATRPTPSFKLLREFAARSLQALGSASTPAEESEYARSMEFELSVIFERLPQTKTWEVLSATN